MTPDKTHAYLQRWRTLEGRRRQLDYEQSQWCFDVRSEFPVGRAGDDQLRQWASVELGLSKNRAEEILVRACAFACIPDKAEYNALGGFGSARRLIPLTKGDRVAVIGEAKASASTITGILLRRHSEEVKRRIERDHAHGVPQLQAVTVTASHAELAAWRRVSGAELESWIRRVCNAAAKD